MTKNFFGKTLGIILIVSGVFLILFMPVYKAVLSYDYEPISADTALLSGANTPDRFPTRIMISSISLDLSVKAAKVVEGKWEVFDDSAAYGLGSGIPGESGNIIIFAHAKRGYFFSLRDIKKKDKVNVVVKDEQYSYEVVEIKEVLPNDVNVIKPTEDETLTLYTCSGFADSKRFIVVAKRV